MSWVAADAMDDATPPAAPRPEGATVHLSLSCNGNYVSQLVVALHSLLEHADASRTYCCHVLTPSGLDVASDERVRLLCTGHPNCVIRPIVPDDLLLARFEQLAERSAYAASAFYRLCLPEVLPDVDRCIYLDCDLFVGIDIAPLYDIDMRGCDIAAVKDPLCGRTGRFADEHQKELGFSYGGRYFNTGVMVLDLARLRKTRAFERAMDFDLGRFRFPDQDALNSVLRENVLFLPLRYNVLAKELESGFLDACANQGIYSHEELASIRNGEPCLVHYAGPEDKPWDRLDNPLAQRWAAAAKGILPTAEWKRVEDAYAERMEQGSLPWLAERAHGFSRVLIYGYTPQSRYLAACLAEQGIPVAGFLDAQAEKQGQVYAGIECFPAKDAILLAGDDGIVVIAAQTAYSAIRKLLVAQGFCEDRIARYIHTDEPAAAGMKAGA